MKRLFLFLLPIMMLGLTACGNKVTTEQVKETVLQGEIDRLPLLKQSVAFIVDDITIDSIHITIADEPMQGYLYTTWIKNGKKQKKTPIIIMVDSIRFDKTRKGYLLWQTQWDDAAKSYIRNKARF